MTPTDEAKPLRLALRVEGDWWVAYIALSDTMDRAKEIGRILIGAAKNDEQVKDGFKALMAQIMRGALDRSGIPVLSWSEQTAPESERAGRA